MIAVIPSQLLMVDIYSGIDRLLGKCESSSSKQQTTEERVDVKTLNLPEGARTA